jgi:hypothetical protein
MLTIAMTTTSSSLLEIVCNVDGSVAAALYGVVTIA